MRISITDKKLLELFKNISDEFKISYEKLKTSHFSSIFKKKKVRKKTKLKQEERCMARKQDGEQCTRRRKHSEYCGKHNKNRPFGRIDNNVGSRIEVKPITIKNIEYLIDKNDFLWNLNGDECLGRRMKNGKSFLI